MRYHYFSGNVVKGPIVLTELRRLVERNIISPDTLICAEGTKKWVKASELLFSSSLLRENSGIMHSPNKVPTCKESHSALATVLVFLATLSVGGGAIMGIASFISGLSMAGIGYIVGGVIGGIMWYTFYVLLSKNK
ncbi:DUF4339 domain-containing protein [uncultured Akkermansia sp.]|uniref:DUF4339 domain-containing protein n=1 Tax=Akkermansia sp. TaxID=1872421 RepID=UPI00205BB14D|nr:DUF4339 domain-containing protein [uncultured Akkermansia sp.]DAG46331.1 MAG TPA: GYF domain 2 [Caudoviricetes sp.]